MASLGLELVIEGARGRSSCSSLFSSAQELSSEPRPHRIRGGGVPLQSEHAHQCVCHGLLKKLSGKNWFFVCRKAAWPNG